MERQTNKPVDHTPRRRPGEFIPQVGPGRRIVRVHGELHLISSAEGEKIQPNGYTPTEEAQVIRYATIAMRMALRRRGRPRGSAW